MSRWQDSVNAAESFVPVQVGLVTDLHYADKASAGTRHYRDSLSKLAETANEFSRDKVDFVVELGDLIDAADSVDTEQRYLKTINTEFQKIHPDRHYVLGNHCVDMLHKEEFLGGIEQPSAYYSFERGSFHFVVLDACFREDGKAYGRKNSKWNDANIPSEQLEWLQGDLAGTTKSVIVFAHQRLDVSDSYGVKNGQAVRQILQSSGRVAAVFQGHSHKNDYREIEGIHYCTLVAMVEGAGPENSGYSRLELMGTGTLRLTGFRKQKTWMW
jgi:alkaline phosphatase